MATKIKAKTFDCVRMQHRAGEKARRATRGMTRTAEVAFWARGTAELLKRKKALQRARNR